MRSLKLLPVKFDTQWELELPPKSVPVRVQYETGGVHILILADWKDESRERVEFFTISIGIPVVPDDAWPVGCIDIAGVTYTILYRMTPSMLTRLNVDLLDSPEADKPTPGLLDFTVAALETLDGNQEKPHA